VLTKITKVKDSFRTKIASMQDSRQSLPIKKSPTHINYPPNPSQHPSIPFPEVSCQSPPLHPQPITAYDKTTQRHPSNPNPTQQTPGFNSRKRSYLLPNHGSLITTINSAHQESSEYLEGLYTLGSKDYNTKDYNTKDYNSTDYNIIRDEDIVQVTPIIKSHVSTFGLK
jgi:hypothetical protein